MTVADFCGCENLQRSALFDHPSSCSLMNGVTKSLSQAPESNAFWSQGFGFSLTVNAESPPLAHGDLQENVTGLG